MQRKITNNQHLKMFINVYSEKLLQDQRKSEMRRDGGGGEAGWSMGNADIIRVCPFPQLWLLI